MPSPQPVKRFYSPPPVQQFAEIVPVPIPHKGINAIAALSQMDPEEAIYAYNVLAQQNGMQVRPGWVEWAINLPGAGGVRTIIPVRSNDPTGTNDHLFATTIDGIYDVTASTSSPTNLITFGSQTGNAGWGSTEHCTNLAGDLNLLYCDEVNGYYTYDTATSTWTHPTQGFQGVGSTSGTTLTISSTTAGMIVTGGELYTIGPTGILTDTGFNIVSGSGVTWTLSGTPSPVLAPGTNIAIINNSNQIYGVNPAQFAFVRLHNNRLWFVQAGSGNAWFLPVGQIYGQASQFSYGNKFQHGGNLNSLWVFTYGSYFGTYLYLVGIGDAGDVIAYTGNDPTNASTWSMAGQWYVGDIPPGRRTATNYGGDLTILCNYGAVNLSSLFYQKDLSDPNTYITKKIAPAIKSEIQLAQLRGWEIVPVPYLNSLLILDPNVNYANTYQFCYCLATNGWTVFKGFPMQTAGVWHGNLYTGSPSGKVLKATGGQDNIAYGQGSGISIQWGMLGAFNNLQSPGTEKFVDLIRPYFLTDQTVPYNTFARFDFNISDLVLGQGVGTAPVSAGSVWDSAIWDSAIWGGGGVNPQLALMGNSGAGRWAALGILGASNGNTVVICYEASIRKTTSFM